MCSSLPPLQKQNALCHNPPLHLQVLPFRNENLCNRGKKTEHFAHFLQQSHNWLAQIKRRDNKVYIAKHNKNIQEKMIAVNFT